MSSLLAPIQLLAAVTGTVIFATSWGWHSGRRAQKHEDIMHFQEIQRQTVKHYTDQMSELAEAKGTGLKVTEIPLDSSDDSSQSSEDNTANGAEN
jgi:hypothetical protein